MAGRNAPYGRLAVTVALAGFAALALVSGLDRLTLRSPGLADQVPILFQAQAARSMASLSLVREQPRAALVAARRAVATEPTDPGSTALLAASYLALGDVARADAAFRVAARFGWRDPATQIYWFEVSLAAGDIPRAVDRADALLRVYPSLPAAERLLGPIEATAAGRTALAARMTPQAAWLDHYLSAPSTLDLTALERRGQTLQLLAARGTRLGCARVTPFVAQAIDRGARRSAEQVWAAHCPGASLADGLADPGFEQFAGGTPSPFGWRDAASGDVGLSVTTTAEGAELRLRNDGAVSRLVLSQALAVPPGTYRLTARAETGRLAASIGCDAAPPLPSLGEGDLATPGGQTLRIGRCARLELGLWLRPGEEATLDDVTLTRLN